MGDFLRTQQFPLIPLLIKEAICGVVIKVRKMSKPFPLIPLLIKEAIAQVQGQKQQLPTKVSINSTSYKRSDPLIKTSHKLSGRGFH